MPEETERVEFNIDTVTVEEAELLEETLDIPWMDCLGAKAGTAKVMRGWVWLHKRRSDPDLKFEDVHFNVSAFGQELGQSAEAPAAPLEPSVPSTARSKSSSTRSTGSGRGKSSG